MSVFCNPDDAYRRQGFEPLMPKCRVGYIEAVSDEYFIMKGVTRVGYPDGYLLNRYDEVFRLDTNGEYEQRLMHLYNKLGQQHAPFEAAGENLLAAFFDCTLKKHLVVGVGIRDYNENSIYAFVKEIDCENQTITLIDLNDNGKETGGERLVYFDAVKQAEISGEDEAKLQLLNQIDIQV